MPFYRNIKSINSGSCPKLLEPKITRCSRHNWLWLQYCGQCIAELYKVMRKFSKFWLFQFQNWNWNLASLSI